MDAFNKYFNEETRDWLLREIKLNKQKPLPASQRAFWAKPEEEGAHDPRGTPSYVKKCIDSLPSPSPSGNIKDQLDEFTHKPHPNVLDELGGSLKSHQVSLTDAETNGNEAAADNDLSDSEDTRDDFEEIEIDDEFQIPEDAVPIK